MDKKIIQISIKDFNLKKRGPMDVKGADHNVLKISLLYPAENIPNIEILRSYRADKIIPTSWVDYNDTIVFKTAIRGKAKLLVECISVDSESKAETFFKGMFASILGAALKVKTASFGSAYVAGITQGVVGPLIELGAEEEEDDKDDVGKAAKTIDSDNLPTELKLDLKVKDPVYKKVYVKKKKNQINKGRRSRENVEVIKKGAVNGSITLSIREL